MPGLREAAAAQARRRLAEDMIAEAVPAFSDLRNVLGAASTAVEKAEQKVRGLEEKIGDREGEVVEHRRPAEEFPEDLRKYLGR